jgi:hypothetical protein
MNIDVERKFYRARPHLRYFDLDVPLKCFCRAKRRRSESGVIFSGPQHVTNCIRATIGARPRQGLVPLTTRASLGHQGAETFCLTTFSRSLDLIRLRCGTCHVMCEYSREDLESSVKAFNGP